MSFDPIQTADTLQELLLIGLLVFGGIAVAGLIALFVSRSGWRSRADAIEKKVDDHLRWHSTPVKRPPRKPQTTNGDKLH